MLDNDKLVETQTPTDKKKTKVLKRASSKIFTSHDVRKFTERGVSQKSFHTGSIKFAKLYDPRHKYTRYFVAVLVGLVMSFLSVVLIQSTGLYTGGFGAICQGIARLTYASLNKNKIGTEESRLAIYNALYWGLYLIINIPLIIFAYFKINKQFALLSIAYLVSMQGAGFLWGIIPELQNFKVFGLTNTIYPTLADQKVQVNVFYPTYFPIIGGTNEWNIYWLKLFTAHELRLPTSYASLPPPYTYSDIASDAANARADWIISYVSGENIQNAFLLLLYCSVYAIFSSLGYALIYILGGSTGGSDFVTIYLSQEKNKKVGLMFIIVNAICMLIGITIGSYGAGCLIDATYFSGWEFFLSANLFISLLFIILNGTLMNKWFPWHKMVKIEIYSQKSHEIVEKLKEIGYTHPSTIINAQGGFSGNKTDVVATICMMIELPNLVKCIRSIDQECLISSAPLTDLDGKFTIQRQTF